MYDEIKNDKTESYKRNADNFRIEGEITVTITLNEYRSLVYENGRLKEENKGLREGTETLEKAVKLLHDEIIREGDSDEGRS